MRRGVETNQGEPRDGLLSHAVNRALYYGSADGPALTPYRYFREHPAITRVLVVAASMAAIVVATVDAIAIGRANRAEINPKT